MLKPTRCHLWKKKSLTSADLWGAFEEVVTYVEENHFSRRLVRCRRCGQGYFKEFYETIDWISGNDPQYLTIIPVGSNEDVAMLKNTDIFGLLKFAPRIESNWPSDAKEPAVLWIGK